MITLVNDLMICLSSSGYVDLIAPMYQNYNADLNNSLVWIQRFLLGKDPPDPLRGRKPQVLQEEHGVKGREESVKQPSFFIQKGAFNSIQSCLCTNILIKPAFTFQQCFHQIEPSFSEVLIKLASIFQ